MKTQAAAELLLGERDLAALSNGRGVSCGRGGEGCPRPPRTLGRGKGGGQKTGEAVPPHLHALCMPLGGMCGGEKKIGRWSPREKRLQITARELPLATLG